MVWHGEETTYIKNYKQCISVLKGEKTINLFICLYALR